MGSSVLHEFFLGEFTAADADGTGRLPVSAVRSVLESTGLPQALIGTLLNDAFVDGTGQIAYRKFTRVVADVTSAYQGDLGPTAVSNEARRARAVGLFRRIDQDGSGKIDEAEMEHLMKALAAKFRTAMTDDEAATMLDAFRGAPITEDMFVDYVVSTYDSLSDEDFFNWLDFCDTESYHARTRNLRQLFWKIDSDGSGFVETNEQRALVKKMAMKFDMALTDEQISEAVKEFAHVDTNGDGKISEAEFITTFLELFETESDAAFMEVLNMFQDE